MSATLTDAAAVLERIDRAERELHAATQVAIQFAKAIVAETAARTEDDDEWLRLPAAKDRCRISNWSRSTLNRRIAAGDVRRKSAGGSVFYAGKDVRQLIANAPEQAA